MHISAIDFGKTLNTRSKRALKNAGIQTLEQWEALTFREKIIIPDLGRKSVAILDGMCGIVPYVPQFWHEKHFRKINIVLGSYVYTP